MNIVLIEFNSHHDECIYSQVAFLKSIPNVKLYLISNYRLKDRLAYLDEFEAVLFVRSVQWGVGHLKILKFLNVHKINKVIFNTISNKSANNLLKICSSRKREYHGVIHDIKDFKNTKYRRVFKKNKSFYVLNDYLLQNIKSEILFTSKVESFYPIFFNNHKEIQLLKPENELWITIPGKMELSRRDYFSLLAFFKKEKLNKNIKLIFLGKSNQNIRKQFEDYDLNGNCVFWDGYISNDLFHSYLQKSDYILPLINASEDLSKRYNYKISGAFNLALSYHIPMIMDVFFSAFDDFKNTAIFYNKNDNIIMLINKLSKPKDVFTHEKWTLEYQQNKYIKTLL